MKKAGGDSARCGPPSPGAGSEHESDSVCRSVGAFAGQVPGARTYARRTAVPQTMDGAGACWYADKDPRRVAALMDAMPSCLTRASEDAIVRRTEGSRSGGLRWQGFQRDPSWVRRTRFASPRAAGPKVAVDFPAPVRPAGQTHRGRPRQVRRLSPCARRCRDRDQRVPARPARDAAIGGSARRIRDSAGAAWASIGAYAR